MYMVTPPTPHLYQSTLQAASFHTYTTQICRKHRTCRHYRDFLHVNTNRAAACRGFDCVGEAANAGE